MVELALGSLVVALLALSVSWKPLLSSKPPLPADQPATPGTEGAEQRGTRLAGLPADRAELPEVEVLTKEGIRLYSAGEYPDACQRFSEAVEMERGNQALRQNVARCFEGWGWQTLRNGKAEEAGLLFRQGLQQDPDSSPLLTGLALAAIHAGRPDDALEPLERAVKASPDAEAALLLARLYDQRDQTDRAVAHLRRVLERAPLHAEGRKLLDKLEREQKAEAGYWKDETRHFVVKYRGPRELEVGRAVVEILEEVYDAVGREFKFFPREKLTVIFYSEERFQDVTGIHHWANGVFDGKIRLPVGALHGRPRALERLLTHEYTHAVVHLLSRGRAPRWLQEGLAQHAERIQEDPDLHLSGGMTLAGLEALLRDGDIAKARTGYQISLWAVRDLLQRGGMERIGELLSRLGRGESADDAVPKVYGLPLAELEHQWRGILGG
ncbi:MAG: tetratricopeptide repeat protein [Candidatus Rokubacteria bacterium]|nr:tetratricopeptide repeat protein [Candidatus Rokubacteria bacterium]